MNDTHLVGASSVTGTFSFIGWAILRDREDKGVGG